MQHLSLPDTEIAKICVYDIKLKEKAIIKYPLAPMKFSTTSLPVMENNRVIAPE
jgi:hypothetical protein